MFLQRDTGIQGIQARAIRSYLQAFCQLGIKNLILQWTQNYFTLAIAAIARVFKILAIGGMMQVTYDSINYQEDQLFSEAIKLWNLKSLYTDLAKQKQKNATKEPKLTKVEKACLRGLLSGCSPRKIATALNWSPSSISVELSKGLYRYAELLTGRQQNVLKNWRDISQWLEAEGYKTSIPIQRQDWGESPDISLFYGRTEELTVLKQWIVRDNCRLVTLSGMGGIGKTALATQLAKEIQGEFDLLIWRSLHYKPSINQLLLDLIQFLDNQQQCDLSETTEVLISRLRKCLRQKRCLIVLDEAENLMRSCNHAGQYQDGYDKFAQLLRQVALERHQSCLLLVSREKPLQIELLEHKTPCIRSLPLKGLPKEEGWKILASKGFLPDQKEWDELISIYRGNCLALHLVAPIIQGFFDGSVSKFLNWNNMIVPVIVPEPLRGMLIEQFHRLDDSEKKIMCFLATNRTPVSLEKLRHGVRIDSPSELINVLKSLERRSMIEIEKNIQRSQTIFKLEPIIRIGLREHYNIQS